MMYIVLSALLFVIPFYYPALCFLLFFAFTPLFMGSCEKKYGFKEGVLWGTIVFMALLYWCLQMLFGYKFNMMTVLFWLVAVAWYALFAGIWFLLQAFLQKKMLEKKISVDYSFILSWLISTVLFIYFITYGSLFFGGVIEGYPFFNPFLICAQYPALIWCLKYIGCFGALLFFAGFQIFTALAIKKWMGPRVKPEDEGQWNNRYFLIAAICFIPFSLGFMFYMSEKKAVIDQSYFIKPWWFTSKEPMFSGYRMVSEVGKVARENKDIRFICMPESAFNWNIHEYYQFIEMMGQDAPDTFIGFGGHRREGALLKSSFFVVKDGEKIFEYDKRHLIPLMERSSEVLTALGLKQLLSQDEFFAYGDCEQNDIVEIDGVAYQVFICSEFFFEAKKTRGIPVLFVCNDAWLCCDYAKEWVELFVQYFAIRYHVPVFFGTVCGKNNITRMIRK